MSWLICRVVLHHKLHQRILRRQRSRWGFYRWRPLSSEGVRHQHGTITVSENRHSRFQQKFFSAVVFQGGRWYYDGGCVSDAIIVSKKRLKKVSGLRSGSLKRQSKASKRQLGPVRYPDSNIHRPEAEETAIVRVGSFLRPLSS